MPAAPRRTYPNLSSRALDVASGPSCHPWLTGKPQQGRFVTISPESGRGDFFEPQQRDVPEETTVPWVEGSRSGGRTMEPADAPPAPRGVSTSTRLATAALCEPLLINTDS